MLWFVTVDFEKKYFQLKCKVRDVYLCCCGQLGISDDRCFGLARRTPSEGFGADRPWHEYFFLDPEMKLSKYAPKQRKLSHVWVRIMLHIIERIFDNVKFPVTQSQLVVDQNITKN
ncbi:hypothetical protein AB6A40_004867 [Gnathostoma spinigerum]|uniref:Uncharacterized protein n=1 Tax=Gnathostoma spinigerum TaxID=75299 RepID=A0ABD6EDS7_9BILA